MKKSIAFLTLLTSTTLFSAECGKVPSYRFELRYRDPKGVGYNEGYGTAELFLAPSGTTSWTPFLDLRGHVFNDGRFAANGGLGIRKLFGNLITGINAYYDYRDIHNLGGQNRVGGGLEFLSKWADLRINGYAPFGDSKFATPECFSHFQCHEAFSKQKIAATLPSADLEIGAPMPGLFEELNLYLALGTYYLFEREVEGHKLGEAWGARGRVDLRLFDAIHLGADVTYDEIFHTRAQGYVGVSFPLGPTNMRTRGKRFKEKYANCLDKAAEKGRALQPVYRQEIIPSESEHLEFLLNACNPIWFVRNTASSGSGTFESPYSTLLAAEQNSAPGDLIYVFYGDGTSTGMNEGIILQDNQRLISSGVSFDLGCVCIPACGEDLKPLITNTTRQFNGYFFGAALANDNEVAGFRFDGTTEGFRFHAVESIAATLFTVRENDVTGAGALFHSGNISDPLLENGVIAICGNTLQNIIQTAGIQFENAISNSSITISNNSATTIPSFFAIAGSAVVDSKIVWSGNQASDFTIGFGFSINQISNSQFLFDDNVLEKGTLGVVFSPLSASTLAINQSEIGFSGNTFDTITNDGIRWTAPVTFVNSTLTADNNLFTNFVAPVNRGISFLAALTLQNSSFAITNNQFRNVYTAMQSFAITSLDSSSAIAVNQNLFENNSTGFALSDATLVSGATVDFSDNQVRNNTTVAFFLRDFPSTSTGGTVSFNRNQLTGFDRALNIGNGNPVRLDQLIVQDNQATSGVDEGTSVFLTSTNVCMENNSFATTGPASQINGTNLCIHFVDNTLPAFAFTLTTSDIEATNLAGLQSQNNIPSLTVNAATYVSDGTCGCP